MAFPTFHDRSFGIFPFFENKTITAAMTLITAGGGEPNDFNSVKLFLSSVSKAATAASIIGSAFFKSSAQILALADTSSSIPRTSFSFSAAEIKEKD